MKLLLIDYIGKPRWTQQAFFHGFQDGFDQPFEFGYGISYECTRLNTVYDQAASAGQLAGRVAIFVQNVLGIAANSVQSNARKISGDVRRRWAEETAVYGG